MKKRANVVYRSFVVGLAALFICTPILAESAYAGPRYPRPVPHHRPPVVHHHYHRPHINPLLPLTFALITVAGMHYYYNRGMYYRELPEKQYVVITPPVGAVITRLPDGYVTFRTGGIEYYYYGDAYYKRLPSGYIVVEPPYEVPATTSIQTYKSASPAIEQVIVTTNMLNVRSGPGMEHPIIFQIPNGTALETHGTAPEWLFVKLPSGEFGWVMKKFTVPESSLEPVSEPVPAEG